MTNSTWQWETQGEVCSIDDEDVRIDLLISGVGWCPAKALYSVRCIRAELPGDNTSWRVLELLRAPTEHFPPNARLIVEVEQQTLPGGEDDWELVTSLTSWLVPSTMVENPRSALTAAGSPEICAYFLRHAVRLVDAPDLAVSPRPSETLALVPLERFGSDIVDELTGAATLQARRLEKSISPTPPIAAYLYWESEPHGLNETTSSRWVWRLEFFLEGGGMLTVETSASGTDLYEVDYQRTTHDERGRWLAWLAVPGNPLSIGAAIPGVPLRE